MKSNLTGSHVLAVHRVHFTARLIEHPESFPLDACICIVDVTPEGADLWYQLDAVKLHASARTHEDFGDRSAILLHIEAMYQDDPNFARFLKAAAEHLASSTPP